MNIRDVIIIFILGYFLAFFVIWVANGRIVLGVEKTPCFHFWQSDKMDELQVGWFYEDIDVMITNYAIIDGKEVRYSFMSGTKDHSVKWDDVVYLGCGRWSRMERIIE